jgi:hypothetical protein
LLQFLWKNLQALAWELSKLSSEKPSPEVLCVDNEALDEIWESIKNLLRQQCVTE